LGLQMIIGVRLEGAGLLHHGNHCLLIVVYVEGFHRGLLHLKLTEPLALHVGGVC